MLLEICTPNLPSALTAQSAGAHRIELCCALESGGLTPSAGTISEVVQRLSIPVMVLIRPREGDFCYSPDEIAQMCADIRYCRNEGAAGVVIGALKPDAQIDLQSLDAMVTASDGLELTFHRAFDFVKDPLSAMELLIERGINRILSSGQAPSAWEGRHLLHSCVLQAADRIRIMPGAGINAGNIGDLAKVTGATEFHCSAKTWRNQTSAMPLLPGLEQGFWVSGAENIRAVLAALST